MFTQSVHLHLGRTSNTLICRCVDVDIHVDDDVKTMMMAMKMMVKVMTGSYSLEETLRRSFREKQRAYTSISFYI